MSHSLKSKTLHGIFWSFLERIGQQGIQFIISIILARLLLPEQFGLIGMIKVFTAIAGIFIGAGFSTALIQRQNVNRIDESSILLWQFS